MVSSGLANGLVTIRPRQQVLQLLYSSGLMADNADLSGERPNLERLTITSKGFQFLLEDRQTQVWEILMYYLTLREVSTLPVAQVLSLSIRIENIIPRLSFPSSSPLVPCNSDTPTLPRRRSLPKRNKPSCPIWSNTALSSGVKSHRTMDPAQTHSIPHIWRPACVPEILLVSWVERRARRSDS